MMLLWELDSSPSFRWRAWISRYSEWRLWYVHNNPQEGDTVQSEITTLASEVVFFPPHSFTVPLTKNFLASVQFFTGPWASLENMLTFSHSVTESTITKHVLLWQHRHSWSPRRHARVTTAVGSVAIPEPTHQRWRWGWRCGWWWRGAVWPQNSSSSTAVRSWPWFGGIREGQGSGIDDSITANQRDRDLNWLSHPAPTLPKGRDVWHHAKDALPTSKEASGWDKA